MPAWSIYLLNGKLYECCSILFFGFLQSKDSKSLLEKLTSLEAVYSSETEKLKSDVERLKMSEEEAKNATNRVLTLQEEIAKLQKELHQTQSEKKSIQEKAEIYKQETDQVSRPLPHLKKKAYFYWPLLIMIKQ